MSFFEVEFPRKLKYGMSGGAAFSTTVNSGLSGYEQRNRNWSKARGKWTVSAIARQNADTDVLTDFDLLRNFHLVVGGMADAFRLYEPTDHSLSLASGTGIIGTGNGSNKIFQLTKTYKVGGRSYVRNITKPITASVEDYLGNTLPNSVIVYLNAVAQMSGYTLDYTTGIITFTAAPGMGVVVSADAQFHYPVRFNKDDFPSTVDESDVLGGNAIVTCAAMELMEVRL